ncbi:dienelactone hydrolase family protein [Lysobacter yangpyeongensis]|uniref:Dienelactone hydrolase family protein n=1 Tax=Lysobacter yangpyeongensis TaxID=346182 RepID=A0ABW0SL54_9GAMM
MSHWTDLNTPHGPVRAWRADPSGPSRGAVVVLQEIFGVNPHIRTVTERLADAGFVALAPSLFDPVERDVELGYGEAEARRGVELRNYLGFDRATDIVEVAAETLQSEGLRTGAVGFCWGGSVAFLANTRLGLPSVTYYGARSVPFLDEPARAPLMFHFGSLDKSIPPADIELHRRKQPTAKVFVYEGADHAFNRDVDNAHYHAENARLAWQRTLDFLAENLR